MFSFDLRLFTITSTLFVSLACMLIILFDIKSDSERHRYLKVKLVLYYATYVLTNTGFLLYFYNTEALLWYNCLFMLNMVSIPVMFYGVVFSMTTTSATERFSRYHYIAPVVISLMMLTLSVVTPREDQLLELSGNGAYMGASFIFHVFSRKLAFRLAFAIFYLVLCFLRLKPYRTYVRNYSSNEDKASLNWLSKLLLAIVTLLIIPISGLFTSRTGLATSFLTQLQALLLMIQNCYLAYHVIKKHYILHEKVSTSEKEEELSEAEATTLNGGPLNRADFDHYVYSQKPYLSANLKITDIAEDLSVKRNELSAFINTEYGLNFNAYINGLRLEEYIRLRSNPDFEHLTNVQLSEKVGFGSYRTYTRYAAKMEEA